MKQQPLVRSWHVNSALRVDGSCQRLAKTYRVANQEETAVHWPARLPARLAQPRQRPDAPIGAGGRCLLPLHEAAS